jgi:hypothetical protein
MDFARLTLSPETFGWVASSLTLVTFMCADMRRLRCAALGANAAFIAYGALAHLWPVLVLHLLLVPVNLWRLADAFKAESHVSKAPKRQDKLQPAQRARAMLAATFVQQDPAVRAPLH